MAQDSKASDRKTSLTTTSCNDPEETQPATETLLEEVILSQTEQFASLSRLYDTLNRPTAAGLSIHALKNRLTIAKDLWNLIRQQHLTISRYATSSQRDIPYFKFKQYDSHEEIYYLLNDVVMNRIADLQSSSDPHETPNSASSPNDVAHTVFDGIPLRRAKLPLIQLPTFDGAYTKWATYHDYFESLIIKDPTLDDVQRLHYLKTSLSGEPANLLNNIPVTADNFVIAWKLLKSRYANSRVLVNSHLAKLFDAAPQSRESATSLRTLRDSIIEHVQALIALGRFPQILDASDASESEHSYHGTSDILVFLVLRQLDNSTRRAWELQMGNSTQCPTFHELDEFLLSRIRALESLEVARSASDVTHSSRHDSKRTLPSARAHVASNTTLKCSLCKADTHPLYKCHKFKEKTPASRLHIARELKVCFNCLNRQHSLSNCSSLRTCAHCNARHHTLLHLPRDSTSQNRHRETTSSAGTTSTTTSTEPPRHDLNASTPAISCASSSTPSIALATATVHVFAKGQRSCTVRALLDQGSTSTFISEELVRKLGAPLQPVTTKLVGIGNTDAGTVRHSTFITIGAKNGSGPKIRTRALVLPQITAKLPRYRCSPSGWLHLQGLDLADDELLGDEPIQLLLGANVYGGILRSGLRKGRKSEPIAQNTIFGWVISGPLGLSKSPNDHRFVHNCVSTTDLSQLISKFWEIEEIQAKKLLTPDELQCENHFAETHTRTPEGRYVVRLPFKRGPPINIGQSKIAAEKALQSLNRRFARDPGLASTYSEFILEYETLGHMRQVTNDTLSTSQIVYLPHHAVIKDSSSTSKLRVVFNASSITSNFTSLNDHLLVGPKLQLELTDVILQWRSFRYVYCADIAKMYRQILVDERDVDYQRILWTKPYENSKILEYQLLTVTYGTACAPYLALRVLRQLALDEGSRFPSAAKILTENIYVDDCLFGADNQSDLIKLRLELCELLECGGFRLRKWSSNSSSLLEGISASDYGLATDKKIDATDTLKVLGLSWNPSLDIYRFNVELPSTTVHSKRTVLSTIARLFDPLGWVSPVIVSAKIFMQRLWTSSIGWDDSLNPDQLRHWKQFCSELPKLSQIAISRWSGHYEDSVEKRSQVTPLSFNTPKPPYMSLHGFADASNSAYAAVVYIYVIDSHNQVTTSLLTSKTRVAPLKPLTVPRLELLAALLLARLVHSIIKLPRYAHLPLFCWTDSSIVLAWLSCHPARWNTFVSHRVEQIQSLLPGLTWRHVMSHSNPADLASRGLSASELITSTLWWSGPLWLSLVPSHWPTSQPSIPDTTLEARTTPLHSCVSIHSELDDLALRFSSWKKLVRVTAWMLRFKSRCLRHLPPEHNLNAKALTPSEVAIAETVWYRYLQTSQFHSEICALSSGKPLPSKSAIIGLCPYLDDSGLLRVGGRLQHSNLSHNVKHPYILKDHPLVRLIIRDAHQSVLHGGTQMTIQKLRLSVWILRARQIVKSVIRSCIPCIRFKAIGAAQLMGALPTARVTRPTRAFLHCGVDYAGPILVRYQPGRGSKSHPAYIALFICLSVRAIHLELVSDYSTAAFLAAFKRFVSRRGLPACMYSDCGTNFKGAKTELDLAYASAIRDAQVAAYCTSEKIEWKFIPPAAPHFGGLWEAGVRSTKHHLRRVLGNHTPTVEELSTLLCQIESCLNSRPLGPLSDSHDDLTALTPGHFLIGGPLNAISEPSILEESPSRLRRWQLWQQMLESFWKRWSSDYLTSLQHRSKWRLAKDSVRIGQLVLVQSSTLPPSKWPLGRVTACHPGSDGLTRVVTVRTASTTIKRPITKLTLLPIDLDESPTAIAETK